MSVIERDFVVRAAPAKGMERLKAAIAWLKRVRKALRHRRQIYRLGEMSDAMLSDIGLTRSDLHTAGALPLDQDPTARLGAIAAARGRARLR